MHGAGQTRAPAAGDGCTARPGRRGPLAEPQDCAAPVPAPRTGREAKATAEQARAAMEGPAPRPTVGRIVHYVMPNGAHRPGIVVRQWGPGDENVQLQVFTDGTNDGDEYAGGVVWGTSVQHDEGEKRRETWHWPERD